MAMAMGGRNRIELKVLINKSLLYGNFNYRAFCCAFSRLSTLEYTETRRKTGRGGKVSPFMPLPMERNFYPEMEAEAVIRLVRETARIHSL